MNERFAGLYWPGADAVGRRIAFRDFGDASGPYWMTIVGVVADIKGRALAAPDQASVYAPFLQRRIDWNRWGTVVVRAEGDPASLVPAVRAAVRAADPDVPLQDVQTLPDKVARAAAPQRFNARVVSAFGLVALILALQGLFGLLAFAVERSRRGDRRAPEPGRAGEGRRPPRGGPRPRLVAGGPGRRPARGLRRSPAPRSSVLFGVTPGDPATYAVAGAALVAVAALACLSPPAGPRAARPRGHPPGALRYATCGGARRIGSPSPRTVARPARAMPRRARGHGRLSATAGENRPFP